LNESYSNVAKKTPTLEGQIRSRGGSSKRERDVILAEKRVVHHWLPQERGKVL